MVYKNHLKLPQTTINHMKYIQISTYISWLTQIPVSLFCCIVYWSFSLLQDVELCKLLLQAFLRGRTIKHCAIKLCLDVYGIGLKMANKTGVKYVYFSKSCKRKIYARVAGYR